jgi:hypothetical protein
MVNRVLWIFHVGQFGMLKLTTLDAKRLPAFLGAKSVNRRDGVKIEFVEMVAV